MSTPVVTDQWAGNLECSYCGRKRLMAEAFSKTSMENYLRKGTTLRCKVCVAKAQREEQDVAAARRQASVTVSVSNENEEIRACASCKEKLPVSAYNRNQWNNKPEGVARCRVCVEQSISQEAADQQNSQNAKLESAKKAVEEAKASGCSIAVLKAESVLSALQAERVTGLKPVKMSSGGRGRGRNSGRVPRSGRGRTSSGRGRGR